MVAEKHSGSVLSVGIDLGTSRSAISSSTGEHFVVDSFVGWPADLVARKVLQREMLIGREAIENRTMLDLHRPLERGLLKEGSPKDIEAARELLRHLLSLVTHGNGRGHSIRAVVGVPAAAMRINKQHLRTALKGVVDNLLIVSEPFAVAYGLNALVHTMVIDIGAGTTDFCVMKGRYPTDDDQRSLTIAGDYVDQQLEKLNRARYPKANFTIYMVREWKEKYSFVGEPPGLVLVTVPVDGVPTRIDITAEMREACESILPPVVETMLDLLASVEPEFQEKVRQNVTLAGGGALIRHLGPTLEAALEKVGGGKVTVIESPVFTGSDGGLALAKDTQDSDWDQLAS